MFARVSQSAIAIGLSVASVAASADGWWRHDHRQSSVHESVEVSNHTVFNTDEIADGATVLVRDFRNRVVTATVTSRDLDPDTAYSIWWAVFNRPQFCAVPYQCTVSDLKGDPRIRASVFWAGGFISDAFGHANTDLRLVPGRTQRELFANTANYGLQNLRGSEIHVVLRSHGEAGVAGTVADQVGTAMLACPQTGCANVFASIHLPERLQR